MDKWNREMSGKRLLIWLLELTSRIIDELHEVSVREAFREAKGSVAVVLNGHFYD